MNIKELLDLNKKNMIICPSSYNEGIFKSIGNEFLYNLKFETPENFVKEILGGYLQQLVMKLEEGIDKDFGPLNVSGAQELINISSFLDDKDFKDKYSKYFVINEGYIECLRETNIIYTDYCLTMPEFHLALNKIENSGIKASLLKTDNNNQNIYLVKNDNIIEEVENTVDLISSLLDKGKDINDILVYCSSDEYFSVFEDVLSYTNIPYQIEKKVSLIETNDGLGFYKFVKQSIDEATEFSLTDDERKESESSDEIRPIIDVDYLLEYKKINPNMNLSIYNTLVSFFNGISYASLDYLKEFLVSSHIKLDNYQNVLRITNNFNRFIDENKILFMCGINQGIFPSTIRYNGLITDEIIKKRNIPDSKKINEYNENYIKNKIYSIKEVYISYTLKNMTKELSMSSFVDKLENKTSINTDEIVGYSEERDTLKYLKAKDTYDNYRSKLPNLKKYSFLKDNAKDIKYYSDFNFDRNDIFKKITKNEIRLSPTAINDYVNCPFKYFFRTIYRLEEFNVQFSNFIGLFFHEYIKNFIGQEYSKVDSDLYIEKYLRDTRENAEYEMSSIEKIFFEIFLDYLPTLHKKINSYFNRDNFDIEPEHKLIKVIQDKGIKVIVKGTADLIVKNKEDDSLYIFDYKTGGFDPLDIENKKGLQMFIYMDAALSSDDYQTYTPFGMFYIAIKHKPSEINEKDDIAFSGYSAIGKEQISTIFNNSKVTLKKTDTIGCVEDLKLRMADVNDVVDEIKKDVLALKFKQTPSDKACKYCKFNEICYSKKVSPFGDDVEEDSTNGD